MKRVIIYLAVIVCFLSNSNQLIAEDLTFAKIIVQETSGLPRVLEYVETELQLDLNIFKDTELNLVAENVNNGQQIICQIFNKKIFKNANIFSIQIIFPISINANEQKVFLLKKTNKTKNKVTELTSTGNGLDLIIENEYFRANLSKNDESEAKSHDAGQLNDLFIKMGFNQLLKRTENRMHWAPSFKKQGLEYYSTSSGWDNPSHYRLDKGPYLISTQRKDFAPDHQEILLAANYNFYAELPYFKFFSSMDIIEDVTLSLLRNDEMTMDSLFTHVAYQNSKGKIIDLSFAERFTELDKNPIDNNAPWICFYNNEKGYAFGTIRIKYDITNKSGLPSPTYLPHTKISNGANGGKYWNRILIDQYPLIVPKGSFYTEELAYIVFKINEKDKFKEIKEWMTTLSNPLEISVISKIFIVENN